MARTKQRARKSICPAPPDVLKRKRAPKDSQGDRSSTFEGFSPPPPFKQRRFTEEQVKEIDDRFSKKQKLGNDAEDEGDEEVEPGDEVRAVSRSKSEEPLTWELLSKKQRKQLKQVQRQVEESPMAFQDEEEDDAEDDDDDEHDDEKEEEAKEKKFSCSFDDELRAKGLTSRERKKAKAAFAQAEANAEAQATLVTRIYQKSTQDATDNGTEEDAVNGTKEDEVGLNTEMRSEEQSLPQPLSKKAKKRLEKQKKKDAGQVINVEETSLKQKPEDEEIVDESIAQMDSSLLADHYAKNIKRHFGDLSTLELDNKYLPSVAFLDTTASNQPHLKKHLRSYIFTFTSGGLSTLRDTAEEKGSPHTLVIAASGLRASHLNNALHDLAMPLKTKTAKLFAKHIKLSEQVAFLQGTRVTVGTGTPERLIQLLEHGALKTENLARIVIDGSHIDAKERSIFDMKETFVPLANLLARDDIRSRLGRDMQVMVF